MIEEEKDDRGREKKRRCKPQWPIGTVHVQLVMS